jgi:hypothetical protein
MNSARRHRASWIEPPTRPDDDTLARLGNLLRGIARVKQAWLVGQHIVPDDGSSAYDIVGVALVLEPPLTDEPREQHVANVMDLTETLRESGFGSNDREAWLFVSESTIAAHQEIAIAIYP